MSSRKPLEEDADEDEAGLRSCLRAAVWSRDEGASDSEFSILESQLLCLYVHLFNGLQFFTPGADEIWLRKDRTS